MDVEINDYIGIFRGAASDDYCDSMISEFERISNKSSSLVVDGKIQFGNELGRRDLSLFFDSEAPDFAEKTNRVLDDCLKLYMDEYIGLKQQNFSSQFVKVQRTPPKGGYHVWHCEHSSADMHTATRVLAWTLYLNDIPEGQGETEFLHQGIRIQPKKGTVCLFPASWTHYHRGNFTTTATKYIATGWYNSFN